MKFMNYQDWMMDKFVAWENTQPRRQSYSAFARYLDINQSSLSQYMAGNYSPHGENLFKIGDKLGFEIYDILGVPRPTTLDRLEDLPPMIRSVAKEIRETLAEYKISGDSPKADSLIEEIMKKHGYVLVSKKD